MDLSSKICIDLKSLEKVMSVMAGKVGEFATGGSGQFVKPCWLCTGGVPLMRNCW